MSLSSIIYRAGICQRDLTEIGLSAASSNDTVDPIIVHRQQHSVLFEFEHSVQQISSLLDHSGSSIQKFTIAVANESLIAMRLLLRRPLYRSGNGSKPHGENADDNFNLLSTATSVLESSQMKRTQIEFAPWAWFSWVKWYALAIVLAELCTARGPEADRAWEVAQKSFDDYAEAVVGAANAHKVTSHTDHLHADERSGLLWRPIARLMLKSKTIREKRGAAASRQPAFPSTAPEQTFSIHSFSDNITSNQDVPNEVQNTDWLTDFMPNYDFNESGDYWNLYLDDMNDNLDFFGKRLFVVSFPFNSNTLLGGDQGLPL